MRLAIPVGLGGPPRLLLSPYCPETVIHPACRQRESLISAAKSRYPDRSGSITMGFVPTGLARAIVWGAGDFTARRGATMAYLPLMPLRLAEGMRRYRRRFDQSAGPLGRLGNLEVRLARSGEEVK